VGGGPPTGRQRRPSAAGQGTQVLTELFPENHPFRSFLLFYFRTRPTKRPTALPIEVAASDG
jgi:hypothetical protein